MKINKKIKSHILSQTVDKGRRKIGIEVECFVYTKNYKRLSVNSSKEYSATDLLHELNNIFKKKNGSYSLEPGGQIEWSSPPFEDIRDLEKSIYSYKKSIDSVLEKRGLISLYIGVEPFCDPDSINLIKQKKYQLMNLNMEKRGTLGKWMMRNTSSIQVNYDIIDENDLEEVMFIADCIHPISAYLFSNSPFQLGKPVGENNLRNHIWENTDTARCRTLFDHKIDHPNQLLDSYIEFMMGVPGIFKLDNELEIQDTDLTLGKDLMKKLINDKIRSEDIVAALHQIFTNVRLKSLIEIRDIDCLPFKHILAPVAFLTGLISDKSIRKRLINEFLIWSPQERKLWNNNASSLDVNQSGPDNRTYLDWITLVGELAIRGLCKRGYNETKYFSNYFYNIIEKGPISIQYQNHFKSSNKLLREFLFSIK
jgi:glutamate--cysteine ligase